MSTDDDEIAHISREYGAQIIQRPQNLALDSSSSESAMLHAIDVLKVESGILVLIQPTSPFTRSTDISQLIAKKHHFDTCMTVCESHAFIWRQSADGSITAVNHDSKVRRRRQDIEEQEFVENGACFAVDIERFRVVGHRFFGRIGFVVMPKLRSFEIDSPEDLKLADLLSPVLDAE